MVLLWIFFSRASESPHHRKPSFEIAQKLSSGPRVTRRLEGLCARSLSSIHCLSSSYLPFKLKTGIDQPQSRKKACKLCIQTDVSTSARKEITIRCSKRNTGQFYQLLLKHLRQILVGNFSCVLLLSILPIPHTVSNKQRIPGWKGNQSQFINSWRIKKEISACWTESK